MKDEINWTSLKFKTFCVTKDIIEGWDVAQLTEYTKP